MPKARPEFFLSLPSRSLFFQPWLYFGIFLVSNTLLSYFPLSAPAQWAIGILGLAVPWVLGLRTGAVKRAKDLAGLQRLDPATSGPPLWLWFLVVTLLLFTRFYRLTTLPFWPLSDEGIAGVLGMAQSQQWHWNLLWAHDRVEPMLIWTLGLFFKVVPPSLFSLRLLPTLVSLMTCLAAYWAARQFFSRVTAFLVLGFFAFSFWELTLSRICLIPIPVPLFQCLCLGFWGKFLNAPVRSWKDKDLWALGFLAGLGFYSWTNWGAVWMVLAFGLGIRAQSEKKPDFLSLLVFLLTSFSLAIPLALARLAPGEMRHVQSLISFSWGSNFASYFKGLFWDGSPYFPFGSNWGGFLDPLLDSLVLLGLLLAARSLSFQLLGALGACLFLSCLPGILTNNVDLHRVLPLFPFLMALAAWGLRGLTARRGPSKEAVPIALVLLGLFSWDAYAYVFHYADIRNVPDHQQWRNVQYWDAYQTLREQGPGAGPLLLFSHFNTDYDNRTLDIAAYPMDALQNPGLDPRSAQWAALILNTNYAPYLTHRFPGLRMKVLKTDKTGPQAPPAFGLFLVPLSQVPQPVLQDWERTDRVYREVYLNMRNKRPVDSWSGFLEGIPGGDLLGPGDPFLTAVYFEKLGFLKFLDGHFIQATEAYRKAVEAGIPARHLVSNVAFCLDLQGRQREAREYSKKFDPEGP